MYILYTGVSIQCVIGLVPRGNQRIDGSSVMFTYGWSDVSLWKAGQPKGPAMGN